jgi:hypothetical protein
VSKARTIDALKQSWQQARGVDGVSMASFYGGIREVQAG